VQPNSGAQAIQDQNKNEVTSIPSVQGPAVSPPTSATTSDSQVVKLEDHSEIQLFNFAGKYFFEVEATYAPRTFAMLEREGLIAGANEKLFAQLKKLGGVPAYRADRIGYFTFYIPYEPKLFASLDRLEIEHPLYFGPVQFYRNALIEAKSVTPQAEGLALKSGLLASANYSGLARINALNFVKRAESDIGGVKVNGSSVRLGVTDTGITYHHPTYYSALSPEKNRIVHMRDYTKEGRVYFSPAAKFVVKTPTEGDDPATLSIDAEWIATPKLPALPFADKLQSESGLKIKVSPEQRALLLAPDSKARLGALLEESMSSDAEKVDFNGNGRVTDKLWMLLVQKTPSESVIYLDASGMGDFRKSPAMADWTSSKTLYPLFAEKIGFEVGSDDLPTQNPLSPIQPVTFASIVGYDPGNHGSHVMGIAGGSRTILNDDSETLARGVAPEAELLMNRVCANGAGCNATKGIINLALEGKADVINMSLGGLGPMNDGYGVQETTVNRLIAKENVLVVISAGNSGPGRQTVGSPSVANYSLSVGASASKGMIQKQYQWVGGGALDDSDPDSDFMLFFSSRGPTAAGGFKPNVAAPGTELSAIQLNAAPGAHAGLDVYWGTSMSAPTATGAYALFLDAIRKFNAKNPERKLTTNALQLRNILIESARPFDVTRFDSESGAKSKGHYTWVDQGTGMIDLEKAWETVIAFRDLEPASAVTLSNGVGVPLEYQPLISMKAPNGIAYDGSRPGTKESPSFGTGIYLDVNSTESLINVHLARRLPENFLMTEEAGELVRKVKTTKDEFTFRTVFFGSDQTWLKAGTHDAVDCWNSPTENLTLLGEGVQIAMKPDGTGSLVAMNASQLNVCVNRDMINDGKLLPGDHGALIYAYRVVAGQRSPVASFIVPVSLTIPHKTLKNSQAYDISGEVRSFGVKRHYVEIPKGTTLVHLTIETPAIKLDQKGAMAEGEHCSGVEIMGLEASNTAILIKDRKAARVSNCDAQGRPQNEKRTLTITRSNPTAGIWDLHIFGQYKFAKSDFRLRADYVVGSSTITKISGGVEALTGALDWLQKETSFAADPNGKASAITLDGLRSDTPAVIAQGQAVFVESALGLMRKYPAGLKSVKITTGESKGNDLDFVVYECGADAVSPDDSCKPAGQSAGPTDAEEFSFAPKTDKTYLLQVAGYEVNGDGKFLSTETLTFAEQDAGAVEIVSPSPSGVANASQVKYQFAAEVLAKSKILTSELFAAGKVKAVGQLLVATESKIPLLAVPVEIAKAI